MNHLPHAFVSRGDGWSSDALRSGSAGARGSTASRDSTHSSDIRYIEAAGCNVSSHKHATVALGELVQVLEALPLLQPGVQRSRGHIEQL